ncbi:uncharacterized protein EI97DRAFT_469988 [Westerdykella ornata]|uniref:CHAT domain-containing protein n=1 Tax=Westerdykella ornata TaxID=318751 RepID=A0A6A6J8J5_WESOR|nr:uncharacterized protein EI97DRAFT_469988 [Westerdykella ornata]KAF2272880.1 hypothetical protein EI97DRAFT_469988 [Westerdykella ornata]
MTVIKITSRKPSAEPKSEDDHSTSASLTVSLADKRIDTDFIHPVNEDEHALITWFIESFAAQEPFNSLRAADSRRALLRYGADLAKCLRLAQLCEETALAHIILEIHGSDGSNSKLSSLHWELLENVELWPSPRPKSVCVVRVPFKEQEDGSVAEAAKIFPQPDKVLNIIVVSARPGGTGDIPHRVVSRKIADIIRRLPQHEADRVRLHLVRPATIDALEETLSQLDKPEYLNIVHFDVHGEYDKGNQDICLAFIEHSGTGLQPRLVPVDTVGNLLRKYKIRHAVLNACNSAREFDQQPSFAKRLMSYGLGEVVAMSFEASSISVETFMSTFYAMLLHGKSTILEATYAGRQRLTSQPMRNTKYGVKVEVSDCIVPVYYSSKGIPSATSLAHVTQDYIEQEVPEPYLDKHGVDGRESDIFLLETFLLLRTNIALVHGSTGIGKSSLLRHFCWWWEYTGLVKRSIFYDMFAKDPNLVVALNTASICKRIHLDMLGELDTDDERLIRTKAIQHLRASNYALIFDSFEAGYLESLRDRQRFIIDFLAKLVGGKTLVTIGSRVPERMGALKSFTHHLTGIDMVPCTALASKLLASYSKNLPDLNSDTVIYFEKIVSLAAGNPLAIKLLMHDLSRKPTISIKDYYFSLMEGNAIGIDSHSLEQDSESGARAMQELLALEDPYLLPIGLFWEYLPRAAVAVYILMWDLEQKYRTSGLYGPREMNMTIAFGKWPEPLRDSVKTLEEHLSPHFAYLTQNRFLQQTSHPDNADGPELGYLSMSPLLTLAFRTKLQGQALDSAKDAFVYFQDYTTSKWAWQRQTWEEGLDTMISNVEFAFNNYLTAASILVSRRLLGTSVIQSSSRLILLLQWGLALDSGRTEVTVSLWDKALDRYWEKMEREGDEEDQRRYEQELTQFSQPSTAIVLKAVVDANGVNITASEDANIAIRYTQTIVRLVTQQEILKLALILWSYTGLDPVRSEAYLNRIHWIRDHRVQLDNPPSERQLYVSGLIDQSLQFLEDFEENGKHGMHIVRPRGMDITGSFRENG